MKLIDIIKPLVFCVVCFVVFIFSHANSQTFFWTDEDGTKHFSDDPPAFSEHEIHLIDDIDNYPENTTLFEVQKVYDGDTIKVTGHGLVFSVRLVGIDAPETKKKNMPAQPFSMESKAFLKTLLDNTDVMLKSYGRDSYNRQLAEVYVGKTNINLEMVKQGMASVYRGKTPQDLNMDIYFENENHAKQTNSGIWDADNTYISPWKWRKKHLKK